MFQNLHNSNRRTIWFSLPPVSCNLIKLVNISTGVHGCLSLLSMQQNEGNFRFHMKENHGFLLVFSSLPPLVSSFPFLFSLSLRLSFHMLFCDISRWIMRKRVSCWFSCPHLNNKHPRMSENLYDHKTTPVCCLCDHGARVGERKS